MPRKSNKKITGVKALYDPTVKQKIYDEFEMVQQKIKAHFDRVKYFEEVVSMKITANFCRGCELFEKCSAMKHLQKFSKISCRRDPLFPDNYDGFTSDELFATFAKGISFVEDLKPETETFSGN